MYTEPATLTTGSWIPAMTRCNAAARWPKEEWPRISTQCRRPAVGSMASVVGTPLVPGNVYRRVLAPAAIDAGLYVQVGRDVADVELREVVMRSGRRHLAPIGDEGTLCGRKGSSSRRATVTWTVLRDMRGGGRGALA